MTIKSKAFKFLLGIAVVIGVAVAASFASAADFGTATLRVGSRGAAVMEVQKVVGANPVDGIFGPMTMAAVKAWQANNGLEADGVVGNYTKAAMNAVSGVVAPSSGCQAGWIVNPFTNQPCGTTTPTTPSTPSTPSTTLKGEEADITFDVDAEHDIDQDGTNQHAFTIEIEADEDGGDALIERLDLKFNTTTAAYRSISRVALEVDGDEIAEADTDSRSDWRGSTDTIRFSDLNLVVKSGKVVEVEVLLDVTDKVTSIGLAEVGYRYSDGTGLIVSEKHTSGAVISVDPADAVSFRITENRSNPSNTSLDVSSSRSNETLAIVDVEVRKGEGTLEKVVVEVEFANAKDIDDVKSLVSRFALNVDGKQVDTISSSALTTISASDIVEMTFDADEFDFEEDDEFEIEVLASFRAYDVNATGADITTVKVTNIELIGYDEGKEDSFNGSPTTTVASGKKDTTSFAPVFTLTQGDVLVAISDVEVRKTGDHDGKIVFDLEVENDRGSILPLASVYDSTTKDLTTLTDWKFDVKGYGLTTTGTSVEVKLDTGGTVVSGDSTSLNLDDGDIATFEVTLTYDSTSNKDFTIEVEKIGGVALGYVWAD